MKAHKKIAYFAGCTTNFIEPEVGRAAVQVLMKNGLQPVFPDQKCCAAPKQAHGDLAAFIKQAEFNIRSLSTVECEIVSACTSCALAIKQEYPARLNSTEAEKVAQRTYDIMEYMAMLRARNLLNRAFRRIEQNLLYHSPCHLRVLGVEMVEARLKLLRSIPGITVTTHNMGCCGMGGTFGFQRSTYKVSMEIGKSLFEEIERLSPDRVVTECPTCKMQIEQGTGIQVTHPIIIMKQAYGL